MTTSCHNGAREQRAGRPEVWRFGEVSSALDVGHTLARRGLLAPWQSVLVSSQRQGRGQLRRNWVSPAGNIYAALRLPMQEPFASSAASTVTGAMLAAALGKLGFEVRLKWPNDLAVLDGDTPAKVAGILLEERAGVLLARHRYQCGLGPAGRDLARRGRHAREGPGFGPGKITKNISYRREPMVSTCKLPVLRV